MFGSDVSGMGREGAQRRHLVVEINNEKFFSLRLDQHLMGDDCFFFSSLDYLFVYVFIYYFVFKKLHVASQVFHTLWWRVSFCCYFVCLVFFYSRLLETLSFYV